MQQQRTRLSKEDQKSISYSNEDQQRGIFSKEAQQSRKHSKDAIQNGIFSNEAIRSGSYLKEAIQSGSYSKEAQQSEIDSNENQQSGIHSNEAAEWRKASWRDASEYSALALESTDASPLSKQRSVMLAPPQQQPREDSPMRRSASVSNPFQVRGDESEPTEVSRLREGGGSCSLLNGDNHSDDLSPLLRRRQSVEAADVSSPWSRPYEAMRNASAVWTHRRETSGDRSHGDDEAILPRDAPTNASVAGPPNREPHSRDVSTALMPRRTTISDPTDRMLRPRDASPILAPRKARCSLPPHVPIDSNSISPTRRKDGFSHLSAQSYDLTPTVVPGKGSHLSQKQKHMTTSKPIRSSSSRHPIEINLKERSQSVQLRTSSIPGLQCKAKKGTTSNLPSRAQSVKSSQRRRTSPQ